MSQTPMCMCESGLMRLPDQHPPAEDAEANT